MKLNIHLALFFLTILISCQTPSPKFEDTRKISEANAILKNYYKNEKKTINVIKLVYFNGADGKPFDHYEERLNRILYDISEFYKEEFKKRGIKIKGIPFDKVDGKNVFHVITGDLASKQYTTNSGSVIEREVKLKTAGIIDFSKDYVLIITSLSFKKQDGSYVFHSPYEGRSGRGSSEFGLCLVPDCDLLDSRNLKDSTKKMIFSERMVENKKCSIAEFNSWYIGGIAHEMGHMFGLRHDFGNPFEISPSEISLMGEYGSRHFRESLWKGKKTSVFSSAAIFQLISHPIFTQSNKNRTYQPFFSLPSLTFDDSRKDLMLHVNLEGHERLYGVVALFRPISSSEYFNQSFFNTVENSRSSTINLGEVGKGVFSLQLLFLLPNGKVWELRKVLERDAEGNKIYDYNLR